MLSVVCCFLFGVCWLLFDGCCGVFVISLYDVLLVVLLCVWLLFVVCCLMFGVFVL